MAKKRSSSSVKLANRNAGNMMLYSVDVRDRVIRRVTQQYNGARDNKRFFLVEAGSAKKAWAKASRASETVGRADCNGCHHSHCSACEKCSVTRRYSDYWICHRCGELSPRVSNLH